MGLKADLPYPTLDDIGEDYSSLRIISPAYAGREGELTAILQYVYQSIMLDGFGMKAAAKTLEEIAATEMHHLQILGTLIRCLGAPPVFTNCPPYPVGYYSSSCVNYTKTPKAMIAVDLCSEKNAVLCYESMIKRLQNERVKEILKRIVADEEVHIKALEELAREM